MRALKPAGEKITLGGNEYGLRFTLNAIDDIQEHFNIGISEMGKLFDDERGRVKNLRYLLTVLINENIDCENDENGEQRPRIDERYVGRQIHTGNMFDVMGSVYKAFKTHSTDADSEGGETPNAAGGRQNE